MEIKVMKDISEAAKTGRCVVLRGSSHHDEIYSMLTTPFFPSVHNR